MNEMKICHLSDTHTYHERFTTPPCDVLIHSGDIGNRTTLNDLTLFLNWFETQPATKKIFIAGNHDLVLDKKEAVKQKALGNMYGWSKLQDDYKRAMEVIGHYNVTYLADTDYVYQGIKFYGSPYSPSFHRERWAFNADRGAEISKHWAKIPSDVNVLITHTPVYGILDDLKEAARPNEDTHAGCTDLLGVIKKRLFALKLHCCGHVHDNFGVLQVRLSNSRRALFSNAAVFSNGAVQLIKEPLIISI